MYFHFHLLLIVDRPCCVIIILKILVMIDKQTVCRNLVPFPDHFSPQGKNWSGEQPILFSFPPPERWRSNQVAL